MTTTKALTSPLFLTQLQLLEILTKVPLGRPSIFWPASPLGRRRRDSTSSRASRTGSVSVHVHPNYQATSYKLQAPRDQLLAFSGSGSRDIAYTTKPHARPLIRITYKMT